ncbi:MAG: hypothetical protein JW715_13860 [Sedimentisphaerales bacterium]|nr:hypothetical protein [Sedimentisphaerales bacterium]
MARKSSPIKLSPVDVLFAAFVCLFFFGVVHIACNNSRDQANRTTCAKNLSVIGKAMRLYANDYEGQYPCAGGTTSTWVDKIPNWQGVNRYQAYQVGSDGSGGLATISSCLYLLIKYAEVSPKDFVCPGDSGSTVFNPSEEDLGNLKLTQLWDFGPHPSNHYSYAYHLPYGGYSLSTSSDPSMAVAADRNPWMRPSSITPEAIDLFFKKDWDSAKTELGNSLSHEREGQNVLFVDGHVSFETTSSCGVDNDNIYTYQSHENKQGEDIRIGSPPRPFLVRPTTNTDSLLVEEPPLIIKTEIKQHREVNSSDLKKTSIVATLDCPMPEHQNVIWCSTFKMAWDKMKDDIIGEPIQVIGAEELAARLNDAKISPSDLNEDSYYATAGLIEKGVIEQIQKDITKRFPSEPVPVFSDDYRTLPNPILAYSYLNVDIGFKYPFYAYKRAFSFVDSNGVKNSVTAFCGQSEETDNDFKHVREQVDILYYEYGEEKGSDWFAVDLCKLTQPYQVVLAAIPRRGSLTELIADVEKKISEFRHDPYYDQLRKLRTNLNQGYTDDMLIVPDVLYKLTHHYNELVGKNIGNSPWKEQGYFIFEAIQMIDFSLSRTGVTIKSEVFFGTSGAFPRRIKEPRHIYFNRPFLIYVKKRGENFSPFFVMWVDNAELLNEFK